MEKAIVTFHDPKSDQKIIFNFIVNTVTEEMDLTYKMDPEPLPETPSGLIDFLAGLLLANLKDE